MLSVKTCSGSGAAALVVFPAEFLRCSAGDRKDLTDEFLREMGGDIAEALSGGTVCLALI
jgi:hypothetical protein